MSFRCQNCGKAMPKYFKGTKVIVTIQTVRHPSRVYYAGKRKIEDRGGEGTQIIKELLTCGICMADVKTVNITQPSDSGVTFNDAPLQTQVSETIIRRTKMPYA